MRDRLTPAVLFGLRTTASGMLALYIAFALQLDVPGWAGTSAVIVAQPVLGATLRKGTFRMLGTLVGVVFAVLLYAAFPQSRVGVLTGLALWAGACGFVATYLRDFASYAATLAGFTAAIIVMDAVASPGGVFMLAVDRGSEIEVGIVCTTVIFSITDLGRQRAALAQRIETVAQQIFDGIASLLRGDDPEPIDRQRDRRRALVAQVAAMDTMADQAAGENYDLRTRIGRLRLSLSSLFMALAYWRAIEQHLRRLSAAERPFVKLLRARLEELAPGSATPAAWPEAAQALRETPAESVSQRLLTDRLSGGLQALARAHDGVTVLRDPRHAAPMPQQPKITVSDPLAAGLNAVRAAAVVGLAELIWVLSGWSSGSGFVTFTTIIAVLFVLLNEAASVAAGMMAAACGVALLAAGVANFALLPLVQAWGYGGFATFAAVVGGMLFVGAVVTALTQPGSNAYGLAFGSTANFMALLGPTNAISFDYAGFLNSGLAILAGASLGAAGYRWLPPLSPALRTARALAGAKQDLRRLLRRWQRMDEAAWVRRLYARLTALPPQSTLQQHAQVLAALSVGYQVLQCRRLGSPPFGSETDAMRLEAARREIAEAVASHPDYLAGLNL